MNRDFDDKLKLIELNKRKIASSIVKAYAYVLEDEEIEDLYYSYFYKSIKETRPFVAIVNEVVTKYEQDLNELYEEYNSLLKEQLDVYNEKHAVEEKESFNLLNDLLYGAFELDERTRSFDKMYISNISKYWDVGLSKKEFLNFISVASEEKIEKLNLIIDKIVKKQKYRDYKEVFSLFNEFFNCSLKNKKFIKFYDKYNLKNISDLNNLLTEVNSFLIDVDSLDEKQKEIIENNKSKYRERMNKDSSYNLNKENAIKLSNQISDIYEEHLFDETFVKSNMGDLLEKYNIEYTPANMRYLVYIYYELYGKFGMFVKKDLGDGESKYCLFNSNIFESGDYSTWDTIIHELIHSAEFAMNSKGKNNFCFKYRALNEVLTEYLTKYAYLNFFDKKVEDSNFSSESNHSGYVRALPVIALLRESCFWKELVYAKMHNDRKDLLKKIDNDYLTLICDCISGIINCSEEKFEYNFNKGMNMVKGIITIIEEKESKKKINNNKKCRK